jgi:hypothetical protein
MHWPRPAMSRCRCCSCLGEPRGRPDKDLPEYVKKNAVKLSGGADAPPFPTLGVDAGVIEPLGKVATSIGHLNVTPDVDGAIRTEPLVLAHFDQAYPSLSLLVAAKEPQPDRGRHSGCSGRLGQARQAQDRHRPPDTRMLTFYYKDKDGGPGLSGRFLLRRQERQDSLREIP